MDLPYRAYEFNSQNEADFYLTDLPESVWREGGDASRATGTMVHIHMFMKPRPGKTPIEGAASTASVRVLVLSNGELGVYGGGGFFQSSGSPGDSTLGGSLHEGTLRLIRGTTNFEDRLGPGWFSGSLSARRVPEDAARLRRVFAHFASFAQGVD